MGKFSTSLNGYDKNEVNTFINEVTIRYSNILDALKQKDQELKEIKDKLDYYTNLESTLNKAILVAEESSTNIKKMAREESTRVIEMAKSNASRIINEALLKADKAEMEAEEIRRKVASYKRRIKAIINEQLEYIDEMDQIRMD